MKLRTVFLLFCTLAFGHQTFATVADELEKEALAQKITEQISEGIRPAVCNSKFRIPCEMQAGIWLSTLDEIIANGVNADLAKDSLLGQSSEHFNLQQLIQYHQLLKQNHAQHLKTAAIAEQIVSKAEAPNLSEGERHSLCSFVDNKYCAGATAITPGTHLRDLYHQWLDLSQYAGGKYANVPRMYLFCRTSRQYPCLMIMRDRSGRPVYETPGVVWSLPLLAYSRRQKKFNETNGNTPAGVFVVDGVMPYADQQQSFGKFRRLILDFVDKTPNETALKQFLPKSNQSETWWQESVIARDMGRGLFRVHGTLRENRDRTSPFYGFYGTAGCVQNRELFYDGIEYVNQQLLLNQLMNASGLPIKFENEPRINAVLYVTNLDSAPRAVTLVDLITAGIL